MFEASYGWEKRCGSLELLVLPLSLSKDVISFPCSRFELSWTCTTQVDPSEFCPTGVSRMLYAKGAAKNSRACTYCIRLCSCTCSAVPSDFTDKTQVQNKIGTSHRPALGDRQGCLGFLSLLRSPKLPLPQPHQTLLRSPNTQLSPHTFAWTIPSA